MDAELKEPPHKARAQDAKVPPHLLRYVLQELEHRGISVEQILPHQLQDQRTDLTQLLSHQMRLSYQQSRLIILKALSLTGDESLGLAVGHRQSITSLGLVSLGILASATGRDALEFGIRFHRLTGSMLEIDLEQQGSSLAMIARSRFHEPALLSFFVQELFASMARVVQYTAAGQQAIEAIEMMQAEPENPDKFQTALGCPVTFKTSRNALHFNAQSLSQPLATADRFVLEEVNALLTSMMQEESNRLSFLKNVEEETRRRLKTNPTIAEIAGVFSMSERSFRRKLAALEVSFRDIISQIRQSHAMELLLWSSLSVEQIAIEVGYSDPRVFRRAFKHWTGETPTRFRKTLVQL
ncbi:AraC family transcriptional regulator [Pseudovibrio sp. Tun.PSC04-5.I4]|uniref:AraC family transcriptional regulator n=1 Tax=Pseudovibrio sp. Tun.PSC04-5.I4 TaxID=1798213 RepID=UPI00088D4A96|nr:AraC family transcriptional regulator [Pseudovibrio sp. Tun.PSC04-5.I4]SDQ76967.1 AraC-type DNA-binding protein [Pseudovibrio sp. Tun.PSC04-5.I4]